MTGTYRDLRSFLAVTAVGSLILGCFGCGHPKSIVQRLAYVRTSKLVVLDPAEQQAIYLRSLQQRNENVANAPLPPLSQPNLARLFPTPAFSVVSLASQRVANMQGSVTRYLARYRDILQAANRIPYELYAREQTEHVRAEYQTELLSLQNRLYETAQFKAAELQPAVTNMKLRLIAVQSQERVFTGQPLRDARSQDAVITTKLAALETEQHDIVAAVEADAKKQLEPRKAALKAQLAASLESYKSQLNTQLETRMHDAAAAQAHLLTQLDLGLDGPHLPALAARKSEVPLNLPLGIGWQNSRAASNAEFEKQQVASAKAIDHEINILHSAALQNTQATARLVAVHHGFVLVNRPGRGAVDITSLVANQLRKEAAALP